MTPSFSLEVSRTAIPDWEGNKGRRIVMENTWTQGTEEFIIQTTKELKNMLKDGKGELFWHKSVNKQAENVCLREYLKHSSQQRSTLWSSGIKERILYTSKVQKKIPWGESKNMKLISNLPLSIIKNQEWILLFFPNNRGNNPALFSGRGWRRQCS